MEAKKMEIAGIAKLTSQLYRLELEGSFVAPPVPGQFLHIKVDKTLFLRRPFSIAGYKDNRFTLLFKVVGEGTKILSDKKEGDTLSVIGPLGKGFPVKKEWKNVYLIGGGTGIAPLVFLADKFLKMNVNIMFFYGARTVDDIAFKVLPYGIDYVFATEDGSYGYNGLLDKAAEGCIKKTCKPDVIYGGGPYGLLKKISGISKEYDLPSFVSMENRMACGTGLCYGCVTKIQSGGGWEYKRICREGPVFNTEKIKWE